MPDARTKLDGKKVIRAIGWSLMVTIGLVMVGVELASVLFSRFDTAVFYSSQLGWWFLAGMCGGGVMAREVQGQHAYELAVSLVVVLLPLSFVLLVNQMQMPGWLNIAHSLVWFPALYFGVFLVTRVIYKDDQLAESESIFGPHMDPHTGEFDFSEIQTARHNISAALGAILMSAGVFAWSWYEKNHLWPSPGSDLWEYGGGSLNLLPDEIYAWRWFACIAIAIAGGVASALLAGKNRLSAGGVAGAIATIPCGLIVLMVLDDAYSYWWMELTALLVWFPAAIVGGWIIHRIMPEEKTD